MKKFLGILVSVCLLLGLMAIPAAAADCRITIDIGQVE